VGLNFCPFAAGVLRDGRLRYAVSHAQDTEGVLQDLMAECRHLDEHPETETTLLLVPEGLADFDASTSSPTSIPATASPTRHRTTRPTTPTARPSPPCTSCTKTAWRRPWHRTPIRMASRNATCALLTTRASPSCRHCWPNATRPKQTAESRTEYLVGQDTAHFSALEQSARAPIT